MESENKEELPEAWVKKNLDRYVEGMIDAVFTEDEQLAMKALDTLEASSRTDMEVFSIGLSPTILARMQKNPEVFRRQ